MDGFEMEVLRRLPLAQSVLAMFSYVLHEPFLDGIFEEHRGRCYEDVLTFATLAYLVRDALLTHEGSGLASFQRAKAAGELEVLEGSVYPKLARLPLAVSVALLRESGLKFQGLFTDWDRTLPACLAGLRAIAIDGKTIKFVRRQLKALRPLRGALLGGKVLVAQDMLSGLALAMNAAEDGERNDVPLVPDLVAQIRATIQESKLWVADRQFCDLNLLGLLTEGEEHFLIRQNRTLGFKPDRRRPEKQGVDQRGRRYVQEWGWVGKEKDKRRRYVRRITLYRPDEEDDVILLTDLLDETRYPAEDLLEAYLSRWGIERMFQKVTDVFHLKQLIGCTPKANIFQTSFCFVIYNMIQIVRAYVARAGGVTSEQVSTEKLFDDVQEELVAWGKLGDTSMVAKVIGPVKTEKQMRNLLEHLLHDQWLERWTKAPSNPRKTRGRTQNARGGRTSVYKVLQQHRAQRRGRHARARPSR
jgi:hypothetical protein